MRKVKILADSVSDITLDKAKDWGVDIIPLTINFRGQSYKDGVTITAEELIKKMEGNDDFPTTSQVTPGVFMDSFKEYIDLDMDIVLITMSEKLSGTYQSAVLAASSFPEGRIHVVNSDNVTGGEYVLVKYGVKLRDEGKSGAEIAATLDKAKERVKTCVAFDTLEFLIRSGRISKVSGFVGGMLGIKPIVKIYDGILHPVAKERGKKKALSYLLNSLREEKIDGSSIICLAHSSQPEGLDGLKEELDLRKIPYDEIHIGGVTCSHVGPNAAAYFLIENE